LKIDIMNYRYALVLCTKLKTFLINYDFKDTGWNVKMWCLTNACY